MKFESARSLAAERSRDFSLKSDEMSIRTDPCGHGNQRVRVRITRSGGPLIIRHVSPEFHPGGIFHPSLHPPNSKDESALLTPLFIFKRPATLNHLKLNL
jgi:hypothetical protein